MEVVNPLKIVRLFVFLILPLVLLSSCKGGYQDTRKIGERAASMLGDGVRVYYSLADEGDEHSLPHGLTLSMFKDPSLLPDNFTLILSARLDTVLEIGIFLSPNRSFSIDLSEVLLMRIREVEKLTDASGEVLIEDNLVIYYVADAGKEIVPVIKKSL